jgi:hypothetical protein
MPSQPKHDGLIVPLSALKAAEAALMEAGRTVAKVELALTVEWETSTPSPV